MKRALLFCLLVPWMMLNYAQMPFENSRWLVDPGVPSSWETTRIDLGPIEKGTYSEYTFFFRNDCDRMLTVDKLIFRKSIFGLLLSQKILKPKEVAYVVLELNTSKKGEIQEEVFIVTNRNDCNIKLVITATIH